MKDFQGYYFLLLKFKYLFTHPFFFLVSAMEQLDQIANVIGESYATADLSDLLSFLKKDGEEEPVEMKEEEEIEEVKQEQRMVETNHYKIKCHILRFAFLPVFLSLFFINPLILFSLFLFLEPLPLCLLTEIISEFSATQSICFSQSYLLVTRTTLLLLTKTSSFYSVLFFPSLPFPTLSFPLLILSQKKGLNL